MFVLFFFFFKQAPRKLRNLALLQRPNADSVNEVHRTKDLIT